MVWKLSEEQNKKRLKAHKIATKRFRIKYTNPDLWAKVIASFDTNKSVLEIRRNYNIKLSAIENAWEDEFGIEKIKERNERLLSLGMQKCLVCTTVGSQEDISRHFMNSKEKRHKSLKTLQDEFIKYLYHNVEALDLDPKKLVEKYSLYCSPTYVRNIYKTFKDYKVKCKKRRSADVKHQHKTGKRVNDGFGGWKPSNRAEAGKRVISQTRYNKVLGLFNSDFTQKKITNITKCKHETIIKVWEEHYTENEIRTRNKKIFVAAISCNIDYNVLKQAVMEGKNRKELSEMLSVSKGTTRNIMKKIYNNEELEKWREKVRIKALKKSLVITGTTGITGSRAENYCYDLLYNIMGNKVIHHDVETLPPFEIDITIPEIKVAICWDGPFHREPIFGRLRLKNIKDRDNRKHAQLQSMGWKVIVIEDNNKNLNKAFISEKVCEIQKVINSNNNKIILI